MITSLFQACAGCPCGNWRRRALHPEILPSSQDNATVKLPLDGDKDVVLTADHSAIIQSDVRLPLMGTSL